MGGGPAGALLSLNTDPDVELPEQELVHDASVIFACVDTVATLSFDEEEWPANANPSFSRSRSNPSLV